MLAILPALAILAVLLLANATLLDDFWQLLRQDGLALGGSDMSTHLLRIRHASELYLPSGHRFGWDPYWFQGFVPFVLYPHLTYVVLALAAMVLPIGIERLFNLYVLAIFVALPLAGGFLAWRTIGTTAALAVTGWLSVLSTAGAGLVGVFVVGLISQQVGTILFLLLAVDVVITRRIDRAAIWLGLIPLVHVHAALVAAVAWLCAGAAILVDGEERDAQMRSWLTGSVLAFLIAAPTALGLFYGWDSVGGSTSYVESDSILSRLASGILVAPQPTMLALAVCFVAALVVAPRRDRMRMWLCWFPLALLLCGASVHKWETGVPFLDRISSTMLFMRTFPFAFVWVAVVAICYWNRFPTFVRGTVLALSLVGVLLPRPHEPQVAKSIGNLWHGVSRDPARSVVDYRNVLRWVTSDIGSGTATLAVSVPRPRGTWMAEAIERTRLPLLGGHGIELTSINNDELLTGAHKMECDLLRRKVRDYSVGYFVGTSLEQRANLEKCLRSDASYTRGSWWAFATGRTWNSAPPAGAGFRRDATWTNLEWTLEPPASSVEMRLPIAMNTRWVADVDGEAVTIEPTDDHMMSVRLPAGAERLKFRYAGYPGEWLSVVVSLLALAVATVRMKRCSPGASLRGSVAP